MITIVDYNAGNLTSVKRALDSMGIPSRITPDAQEILHAQRIIVPGVGHAAAAMATLRKRGIDAALRAAFMRGAPILGICLGAQIILSRSEEGPAECLGLIPGDAVRFRLSDPALKIPHMGWNNVTFAHPHPLFAGVENGTEFYFVHSYYPQPDHVGAIAATCEYEAVFPCVIGCRNLIATQFHPEKSGRIGLRILQNFAVWDGAC